MDGLQACGQGLKVADIVGFIRRDINGEIAIGHLAQNAAHIINGLSQAAADPVGGLCDHADLVRPAIKSLQLLVGREVQIPQAADCPLDRHQVPSLPAQHEQRDQDYGGGHSRAQRAHQDTHSRYGGIHLRGVVPNHKDPAAVLQILVDHQLPGPILIPVGICTGLGIPVRLNTLEDLPVSRVGGFGIQQRVILVIEIDACVHIQEYILAVGQTLDVQIQQCVHQMAGKDAGPHISNTPLVLKDRVVHGQDHAAGTGRLHNPQVGQFPPGQYGILKALQGISRPGSHADGAFGGVRQDMGGRSGDVQSLEHAFDGGKILCVALSLFQQRRVIRVQKQVADLAPQGKGGHIFLRRKHIVVYDSGSGLYGVNHLVGNILFDHGCGIGRYNQQSSVIPIRVITVVMTPILVASF